MKKIAIAVVAVITLSLAFAAPAFAGGKGAVKTDMVIHTDSASCGQPGTVVGSAILNTTAKGCLIVVVNLDSACISVDDETTPLDEGIYDVVIHINGTKIIEQVDVDCLKVNAKGQGTANVKIDLTDLDEDLIGDDDTEIDVKISVRPSFTPKTTPCYVNGPAWPTEIQVPLK